MLYQTLNNETRSVVNNERTFFIIFITTNDGCVTKGYIIKQLLQIHDDLCREEQSKRKTNLFSMMSLKRQHSKKGNFVSCNAGLLERDFGYS